MVVIDKITEIFLLAASIEISRIAKRKSLYLIALHSQTQYIINFQCLRRLVTTFTLCIQIPADPVLIAVPVSDDEPVCQISILRKWDLSGFG